VGRDLGAEDAAVVHAEAGCQEHALLPVELCLKVCGPDVAAGLGSRGGTGEGLGEPDALVERLALVRGSRGDQCRTPATVGSETAQK
jgi:hypothetical protein